MKIAQVAPLAESVPPRLYGGTERVVSYLTEALVGLGHEVTLFASGDSRTAARLVACAPSGLRLAGQAKDGVAYLLLMLEHVRQRAPEFDVLHFHTEHLHLPIFRALAHKTLTTLHGRLDLPGLARLYRRFGDMPLVSISDSQREPMREASWLGTVHHGLPAGVCGFTEVPRGDYFAFLGRIAPGKRPDRAIRIAALSGVALRLAAKVDAADEAYFRAVIAPRLGRRMELVGEVNEHDKPGFLGNAQALIFPIDWPEPFGLAMIEAMSCGTPVIAWDNGAVREIVEDGVTGFIVTSIAQAVRALREVARFDRRRVRQRFEARFTAERMAQDYLRLYRRLADARPAAPRGEAVLLGP